MRPPAPNFTDPARTADPTSRRAPAPARAIVFLVLAAAAVAAVMWKLDLGALFTGVLSAVREAGPWWFFSAMAVLPALGAPLLPFTLAAGPAFAPSLGLTGVLLCAIAAVAVNNLLAYWISAKALQPLIRRLLARFRYGIPTVPATAGWEAVLLIRLAPGLPFWVQSYALGLLRVPLLPYAVLSTAIPAGYIVAAVVGAQAFVEGRTKLALLAIIGLGFVAAALRLRRKTLAQRTAGESVALKNACANPPAERLASGSLQQ